MNTKVDLFSWSYDAERGLSNAYFMKYNHLQDVYWGTIPPRTGPSTKDIDMVIPINEPIISGLSAGPTSGRAIVVRL